MRPDNMTLKRLLSQRFPATTFRVYSGRGTASGWSHVQWSDGPSTHLVESFLATLGAAPGSMDNTDYFNGERVSTDRKISDAFRDRVAAELLAPKPVPPLEAWTYYVNRPNAGGSYDFQDCVHRATSRREYFESERFNAHAWLEAWSHGQREAPTCVRYA